MLSAVPAGLLPPRGRPTKPQFGRVHSDARSMPPTAKPRRRSCSIAVRPDRPDPRSPIFPEREGVVHGSTGIVMTITMRSRSFSSPRPASRDRHRRHRRRRQRGRLRQGRGGRRGHHPCGTRLSLPVRWWEHRGCRDRSSWSRRSGTGAAMASAAMTRTVERPGEHADRRRRSRADASRMRRQWRLRRRIRPGPCSQTTASRCRCTGRSSRCSRHRCHRKYDLTSPGH